MKINKLNQPTNERQQTKSATNRRSKLHLDSSGTQAIMETDPSQLNILGLPVFDVTGHHLLYRNCRVPICTS
jgi:hypothetical protein